MSRAKKTIIDDWTKHTRAASQYDAEYPVSEDFNEGVEDGKFVVNRARMLVDRFKKLQSKKLHERNGDIVYHMLAFRYGYNNFKENKNATESIGSIYSEVFEDETMRTKYTGYDLRTNKDMIQVGKDVRGKANSMSEEQRLFYIAGLISAFKKEEVGQELSIERPATKQRSLTSTNTASASSASTSAIDMSRYVPFYHPDTGQLLSYTDRETRQMYPPSYFEGVPGAASSRQVVDDDDDEGFAPVPDTPGMPSSTPTRASSGSVRQQRISPVARSSLRRSSPGFSDSDDPFPESTYRASSPLRSSDNQKTFQREFLAMYDKEMQSSDRSAMTYFDFAASKATTTYNSQKMFFDEIAKGVILVEDAEKFRNAMTSELAFIEGYGAGELYHYAALQSLVAPQARAAVLDAETALSVVSAGFFGAMNRYFALWLRSDSTAISNEMLINNKLALITKLSADGVVQQLYALWKGTGTVYNEKDEEVIEFSHFALTGIKIAVAFLATFIRLSPSIDLSVSNFFVFVAGALYYMTEMKRGGSTTFKKLPTVATTHIENIKSGRTAVLEQEDTDDRMSLTLNQRNSAKLIQMLDPSAGFYAVARRDRTTSVDRMAQYVKEMLGVDLSTNSIQAGASRAFQLTWGARVLNTMFTMIMTSRATQFFIENVSTRTEKRDFSFIAKKAKDEREVYKLLVQLGDTFDYAYLTKLFKSKFENAMPSYSEGTYFSNALYTDDEEVKDTVRKSYCKLLDRFIEQWTDNASNLFLADFSRFILEICNVFWDRDGQSTITSPMKEIVQNAYYRKFGDLNMLQKNRRGVMKQRNYSVELLYAEKEYLLLTEVIAMIYHVKGELTSEREEIIAVARDTILSDAEDEVVKQAVDDMMNSLWSNNQTDGPFIAEEEVARIIDEREAQTPTEQRRRYDPVEGFDDNGSYSLDIVNNDALSDLSERSTVDSIRSSTSARELVDLVYVVEMQIELNIFLIDVATRNWKEIITFGDVASVINGDDELMTAMNTALDDVDVQEEDYSYSSAASSVSVDAADDENDDSLVDEPTAKQQRVVPASPVQQPTQLYQTLAASSYKGKLHALVVESSAIDERTVMLSDDSGAFSDGKRAGEDFASQLAKFVQEVYSDNQRANKFSDIRAYAITLLSGVYNERASSSFIEDQIWDMDFDNIVSAEHEIDVVRRLLKITEPVANAIFDYRSKRPAYMRGFIVGYEMAAQIMIDVFASNTSSSSSVDSKKRTVRFIDAEISSQDDSVTFDALLASMDRNSTGKDAKFGLKLSRAYLSQVELYAINNFLQFSTAFRRSIFDLKNAFDAMVGQETPLNAPLFCEFAVEFAAKIFNYEGDRAALLAGFFSSSRQIPVIKEGVVLEFSAEQNDSEFFPTQIYDIKSIVSDASNARVVHVLKLTGNFFDDKKALGVVLALQDKSSVRSLECNGTTITNFAPILDALTNLERLIISQDILHATTVSSVVNNQTFLKNVTVFYLNTLYSTNSIFSDRLIELVTALRRSIPDAENLRDFTFMPYLNDSEEFALRRELAGLFEVTVSESSTLVFFECPFVFKSMETQEEAVAIYNKLVENRRRRAVPTRISARYSRGHHQAYVTMAEVIWKINQNTATDTELSFYLANKQFIVINATALSVVGRTISMTISTDNDKAALLAWTHVVARNNSKQPFSHLVISIIDDDIVPATFNAYAESLSILLDKTNHRVTGIEINVTKSVKSDYMSFYSNFLERLNLLLPQLQSITFVDNSAHNVEFQTYLSAFKFVHSVEILSNGEDATQSFVTSMLRAPLGWKSVKSLKISNLKFTLGALFFIKIAFIFPSLIDLNLESNVLFSGKIDLSDFVSSMLSRRVRSIKLPAFQEKQDISSQILRLVRESFSLILLTWNLNSMKNSGVFYDQLASVQFSPSLKTLTLDTMHPKIGIIAVKLAANENAEMISSRISPRKAHKILHDGQVRGHPLSDAQRRYFGAMSSSK